MDVVDLDKVLDDFEFNEEKTQAPKCVLNKEQTNQVKANMVFTNNNELNFTPSSMTQDHIITSSTTDNNCSNEINSPIIQNATVKNVSTYPVKSNVNVANVFTSLIEYINAGNDQIVHNVTIESIDNSSVDQSSNDMIPVKPVIQITSILEDNELNCDQALEYEEAVINSSTDVQVECNHAQSSISNVNDITEKEQSKDKDKLSCTVSPDSETDDDISDQDLSGSMQTSLSYTADNQGLKVVGFNSTMDDISDAELESYLQQIEIEHGNMEMTESAEPEVKIDTNMVKCSLTNEMGTTTYIDSTNSDNGLYITDTENIINYDSISQASTVEINDAQSSVDNVSETEHEKQVELMSTQLAQSEDLTINDSDQFSSSNTDQSIVDPPEDMILTHPSTLNIPPFTLDFQIQSAGQTPMNSEKNFEDSLESPTSSEQETTTNNSKVIENESNEFNATATMSQDHVPSCSTPSVSYEEMHTNNSTKNESKNPQELSETNQEPIAPNMLGKLAPYWIPDHVTSTCMQCGLKFTVIKRRHHCRACGQVLCSRCCCMKAKLVYLGNTESRVCLLCFEYLNNNSDDVNDGVGAVGGVIRGSDRPNPNNPMEYCSVIPPLQQVGNPSPSPISVMVPIGVLKREGSQKNRTEKTVMFSDGIRPGSDLTKLDHSWDSPRTTDVSQKENLESGDTPSEI